MIVNVIHMNKNTFAKVAEYAVEDGREDDVVLEEAFVATQNVEKSWSPNRYRSTTVGDWIDLIKNGEHNVFEVGCVGFKRVL